MKIRWIFTSALVISTFIFSGCGQSSGKRQRFTKRAGQATGESQKQTQKVLNIAKKNKDSDLFISLPDDEIDTFIETLSHLNLTKDELIDKGEFELDKVSLSISKFKPNADNSGDVIDFRLTFSQEAPAVATKDSSWDSPVVFKFKDQAQPTLDEKGLEINSLAFKTIKVIDGGILDLKENKAVLGIQAKVYGSANEDTELLAKDSLTPSETKENQNSAESDDDQSIDSTQSSDVDDADKAESQANASSEDATAKGRDKNSKSLMDLRSSTDKKLVAGFTFSDLKDLESDSQSTSNNDILDFFKSLFSLPNQANPYSLQTQWPASQVGGGNNLSVRIVKVNAHKFVINMIEFDKAQNQKNHFVFSYQRKGSKVSNGVEKPNVRKN